MKFRQIAILVNPIAGKGEGERLALTLSESLQAKSCRSVILQTEKPPHSREYEKRVANLHQEVDAAVVIGGDGTVLPLFPSFADSDLPFLMYPAGNESLFAKRFGITKRLEMLLAVLEQGRTEKHHFGYVNNTPFFSMVSIGLDSQVIHRIHQVRTSHIGHIGYVLPTLSCFFAHVPPCITLTQRDNTLVNSELGYLVIANSAEYALKLNPVPEADSRQGMLFACFYPGLSRSGYLKLSLGKKLFGRLPKNRHLFAGKEFSLTIAQGGAYPAQADGEPIGAPPLHIRIAERQLTVIIK